MSRSRVSRWFVVTALIVATASVAAGCSDSSDRRGPSEYGVAYVGLCRAAREARRDELEEARRTFLDRSHGPLHKLASAVQARDRAVAGRLLEAKQAVEAELEHPTAKRLAEKLSRLAARTAAAISTVGDDRPEPCSTEES